MELDSVKDVKFRAGRLAKTFEMRTDEGYERIAGKTNRMSFDRDIDRILSPSNELRFITSGDNRQYAEEIFKLVQKMFNQGNKILSNSGTNREMHDVVGKMAKEILDYLYLIENNPQDFKEFLDYSEKKFDETHFLNIADKIKFKNKNKDEKLNFYQEELNGGDFLVNFVNKVDVDLEEVVLYGIDRDIDIGIESREKGINTARRGLLSSSDNWVDLAISTNEKISFGKKDDEEDFKFLTSTTSFERTLNRKLLKKDGIIIFNAPFYKMELVKREIKNYEILSIINTEDEFGNLVFVVKNRLTNSRNKENLFRQAEFMPQTLPKTLDETIVIEIEATEPPKNFRAAFVDLEDIQLEFTDIEPSSSFVFNHFRKEDDIELSGRPLEEPKEGHIPTLATSGIVSGRYIDEVLEKKVGERIGFDNLIETKIVKREIEEKQRVSHNNVMVDEVSLKKSNIIVSTALTVEGEFIELFSNETES